MTHFVRIPIGRATTRQLRVALEEAEQAGTAATPTEAHELAERCEAIQAELDMRAARAIPKAQRVQSR